MKIRDFSSDTNLREVTQEQLHPKYEVHTPRPARNIVLDTIESIQQEKSEAYGDAGTCFGMIAGLWSAYTGTNISAIDVGLMMAMLKCARHKTGSLNLDNFVDGANYIALVGDLSCRRPIL